MSLIAKFFHVAERPWSVGLEETALDAVLLGVTGVLHLLDCSG